MARNEICLLNRYEADEWEKTRMAPSCTDHKHITQADARRLVGQGDHAAMRDSKGKAVATAKWVRENKSIVMNTFWEWRPVTTESGHTVMNLLELGFEPSARQRGNPEFSKD